jgi:kinesin family member 1
MWSHDQVESNQNANMNTKTSNYADQLVLYDRVGKSMVDNAMQGYHTCLLAHGPNAAGKSYSLFGSKGNRGVIEMASDDIFNRVKSEVSG